MLKNHQFYYLLAKLANKGQIDWENDRDFTESERAAIRQGINDLAFYSPYQSGTGSGQQSGGPYKAPAADAEVSRKASRK